MIKPNETKFPMTASNSSLRRSILQADPLLSRYDPLPRILCVDRFTEGMQAWQAYFPDYDGATDYPERDRDLDPLDQMVGTALGGASQRIDRKLPLGPRAVPMLSSLTSWDVGTAGSWDGCYALKIPTIARAHSKGLIVKRLGSPWRGKFRIETYFTYKADPADMKLGERDVHSFFFAFDVMDSHDVRLHGREPVRWWPSVRYLNCENGQLVRKWQANFHGSEGVLNGPWTDIPGGQQDLGFNRSPTKYQWHYLRFTFDLEKHTYSDFNCAGREFKVAGRKHVMDPPLTGFRASTERCPMLVNAGIGIETNSDKRCFLYLNSVVVSATEK